MSREDIIRRIVERESQKRGLTEEAVLQDAPELHQVACEQFGAWDTALQYAGVSLRRLYAKPRYTREDVIQRIRTHCRRRCKPTAEYFRYHDRQLYVLARQYFGTWRQVLQAAGLNAPTRPAKRRRMTKVQCTSGRPTVGLAALRQKEGYVKKGTTACHAKISFAASSNGNHRNVG